jgi:IclR family acetate operon transcriptional repressor
MTIATHVPRRRGRPPKQDREEIASIQALDRGVRLLELLSASDGMLLTELAAEAEMAPSTTHRVLTTLIRHRFVRHDPMTNRWSVGLHLFELGQTFARNRDVITVSRPKMDELKLETGETISLALADDDEIIFVAQVETEASLRAFLPPGERGPLHASGCGKAVIATWPDDRIARTVNRLGMPVFTPNTLRTLPALMGVVAEIRAHGWSVNDGEHTAGMRCVAAPIFDSTGRAIAAMSISGPAERIPRQSLPALGEVIRGAASEITSAIGGRTEFFDRPAPKHPEAPSAGADASAAAYLEGGQTLSDVT